MDFAAYDKRHYKTLDVRSGYREWSKTYDAVLFDELHVGLLTRVRGVVWSEAERVLDLACGTGGIGVWLRAQGVVRIDGVDFTPEMMEQAQAKNVYDALHHADICDTGLPPASFDLITEVLACEHLEDLAPLYAEAGRLATRPGTLIIVGYHPHFLLNGIPTHFDGADGEPIAIESYVHLFSDHTRAAQRAGWALAEMDEAVVDETWVQHRPGFAKHQGLPVSFSMVWRK